ncbi:hypothetical protein Ancab_014157 [Ancistrocladus abbreviatus]
MESRTSWRMGICMNILCGTTSSVKWKRGWTLRSGEPATLCDTCGSAYGNLVFCETYHADDSGWRSCVACGKRLHCGCIASLSLIELLDCGGVKCKSCPRDSHPCYNSSNEKPDGSGALEVKYSGSEHLETSKGGDEVKQPSVSRIVDANGFPGQLKMAEVLLQPGEIGTTCGSNFGVSSTKLSQKAIVGISSTHMAGGDFCEVPGHPNLNISLAGPTENPKLFPAGGVEEREPSEPPSDLKQGPPSCNLLPRPPKSAELGKNASIVPQIRVARPPVEGRGRNQLLPRYWPRITDQELQQISGDSNCTIVPLFEKVLSASDAGRIGRLVLPKACAEAYFPPISQPEGVPLKIQDVKGKEWVFQFRFWPNNNSRMYVLEGVTPCIQSMQLQAGDTVTFSRMDPVGKLVMGFRKASNSLAVQGSTDPHLSALSGQLNSVNGPISWRNSEKYGGKTEEGMFSPLMLPPERKRSRNIGSKSKRLLIDSQEVLELRLTWEEVQDMLRPPQSAKPSVVVVDDYEFEEYEEPPVFGKWSIFAVRSSGVLEQWTQCDSCFKWRRIPVDILLPPRWTCGENAWDQSRCSCSVPDELSPRQLENFLQLSKDFKKKRVATSHSIVQEQEPSGLDALANAATLGDNVNDPSVSSIATTTKHPRHRPGCSCIVCIQPPSGKGKHKPTCACIVCMTVKRRFKTLMTRKKQRQSAQEAEIALRNLQNQGQKDEAEVDSTLSGRLRPLLDDRPFNEVVLAGDLPTDSRSQNPTSKLTECSKRLDLNCQPAREVESQGRTSHVSMTGLLQLATLPLETYMKQNGLTSLTAEQQVTSETHALKTDCGETEGHRNEDLCSALAVQEAENASDECSASPGKTEKDPE